jgi:hypothetical protein
MRRSRPVVLMLVLVLTVTAAVSLSLGDAPVERPRVCAANQPEALAGLRGVRVRVQLDGDAADAAVREGALRPLVELQLQKNRIEVLDDAAAKQRYPQGPPLFFVYVAVMDAGQLTGNGHSFFYSANVNLWEDVTLRRDPQRIVIGAATWRKMSTGRTSTDDPAGEIYHTVLDLIDAFAADDVKANPRS